MNNQQRPIKGWGVCVIQGRGSAPQAAVEAFVHKLTQIYEGHGGLISAHPTHGKRPWIGPGNLQDGGEMGESQQTAVTLMMANTLQSPKHGTRLATATARCLR